MADVYLEPVMWVAAGGALVAGLVRGFAGFGAGMIYIPVAASAFDPRVAAGTLFIIDTIIIIPLVIRATGHVAWREIAPLGLGAMIAVPAGVAVLIHVDPVPIRWGLSAAILASIVVLASGWRYRGESSPPLAFGVGTVSGFMGGLANLYGPPIVLFWLGGQSLAPTVRANIFAYSGMMIVVAGAALWFNGLFGARVFTFAFAMLPVYAIALWAGTRAFRHASESLFRWIALVLCGIAALAGLPVWDGF